MLIQKRREKRNLSGTRLVDPTPTTVAGPARTPTAGRDSSGQTGARLGRAGRGPCAPPAWTCGRRWRSGCRGAPVAVDLERDSCVRANLEAPLAGGVFVDPLETCFTSEIPTAGEAIETTVLSGPGGRQSRALHLGCKAHPHLAPVAGPCDGLLGVRRQVEVVIERTFLTLGMGSRAERGRSADERMLQPSEEVAFAGREAHDPRKGRNRLTVDRDGG